MDIQKLRGVRTMSQLASKLRTDPELATEFANNAPDILEEVHANRIPNNTVYKIVVGSLGLALLFCVLGVIFLAWNNQADKIPDMLVATAAAAVGALAGLLAPQPNSDA